MFKGLSNQNKLYSLAFQLSVSPYNSRGKRWQGYGFSNFDCVFLKVLCLHFSSGLSGTTNFFSKG